MAVIADRCPQVQVTVVDINQARIDAWNDPDLSRLPVYEPGLDAVVGRARGRNLSFSTAVEAAIADADMVFISVNTPTKTRGLGAGHASDLRWVEACARTVAQVAQGETIVVEKSTLPVRTAAAIKTILEAACVGEDQRKFSVLSNPEFLAKGRPSVIWRPQTARSVVTIRPRLMPLPRSMPIGSFSSKSCAPTSGAASFKLTANAFLAQRISSINAIAAFCEARGGCPRGSPGHWH